MTEATAQGRGRVRRRRDRRGRGLRGRLAPAELPISLTRAEQFDELVYEAVEHLERRWSDELSGVEFAVEDVPAPVVVLEGGAADPVPLTRLIPPAGSGREARPARIVVYRRPLEARASDREDLAELVLDVIVHEVAQLLGVPLDVIDPEGHGGVEPEDDE
jgi:predicted Zn-dependent protease with MMP-like domain